MVFVDTLRTAVMVFVRCFACMSVCVRVEEGRGLALSSDDGEGQAPDHLSDNTGDF